MDTLNFGVIGSGRIAVKFCETFKRGLVSGGRILAAASRDMKRAGEFAAANGIGRAYGSYDDLLLDREIDIVYIALTNEWHFPVCEKAIRAGKHILCEKPMTTNAPDARKLAALAKEKGVFLMEALWTRFLPAIEKAESWVKEGRIGNPRGVKATICARRTPAEYPRLFDPAKGGGALLDLGIYGLHFARHFAGSRALLECKASRVLGESGVDITDAVILEYSGGFIAEVSCSIDFFACNEAYISGENGFIRVEPWFSAARGLELFSSRPGDRTDPLSAEKFSADAGFEFEIRRVMECIRGGKIESETVPLADTIEALEIIDKIGLV